MGKVDKKTKGILILKKRQKKILTDLKTFGFLFEALVERDLRIYMENLGGRLCHFRDNVFGLEVDSVLELENGDYVYITIKCVENIAIAL